MRLPINTEALQFIVAVPPKPVPVYGGAEGEHKQDREGRTIHSVGVLATTGTDADVLTVKVPGQIEALVGENVRLRGLTAEHWEMGERSGVSFRAEVLERAKPASAKQPVAGAPAGKG